MVNLRSLMDLLPYYFREQDTYKVDGKGLLERYLDIFGAYFDNDIVKNIDTLDDIIDIDKTPEIYLGYLWEFLGSMPYANPKAIDPDKWKQYFNGFYNNSTIESLSRLWVYRKDYDNDHYNLDINQVRSLVKYSVALFSIRGTKRFFEVLLRLYGFEVTISMGSTYPKTTVEDDDDSDYWGSDTDYYGTDDDYAGSVDSLFDNKTEVTKLDSEWLNLDEGTLDKYTNCNVLVNVNFRLKSDYTYTTRSNEFKRLNDRMFNLINTFLPIGTRPHLIWDGVNSGDNFTSKVNRLIEVYVDRVPINWTPSDDVFVESDEYPGWYRVYNTSNPIPARDFNWLPIKFMVKVKDIYYDASLMNQKPAFIQDQPKRFVAAFNGSDYSETEYEDGHIFTLKPGNDGIYYPKFKVSVLCEEDFDLSEGTSSTFIISKWLKMYNYTIFKHYNSSVSRTLSNSNTYIPILIQSASIRTYTNDANPGDDVFTPSQVVNLTTGEYLTLCSDGTTIPDRDDNPVDYSQYTGRCVYVQHILSPGTYEFAILDRPEYKFTLEIKIDQEVLTVRVDDPTSDIILDDDNPTRDITLIVESSLTFLDSSGLLIKEASNPNKFWESGETITINSPGHYRFYGIRLGSTNVSSNIQYLDINVLSNKYNSHYYLELEDGDKSDDEIYKLRTLIPRPGATETVTWGFDFIITVDKSVVEALDILVSDPGAFDLMVGLYRGGTPNRGTFLGSYIANVVIEADELHNVLPNYKVKGTIQLTWDGSYDNIGSGNYPPGVYCVELHDKDHVFENTSSYRLVDAYVIPQKFDGNLYFDVDIISKAWTSPAGQIYDIDPITGRYTWGWFKTNEDYLHSVRIVRYDPSIDTPRFRLKLTNNTIGYTRVYMYKLVENGYDWDIEPSPSYPRILPPILDNNVINKHWLEEAIPKDWGFPGEYNEETGSWDYSKGDTGVVEYMARWLFTGSIYQVGDIITGPQEPGKYIFIINQLGVDNKIINYAYLEVKENIQYSLIVDPLIAILQGTVVSTKVDAISSSKYTKETLEVTVTNPDGTEVESYYTLPYAFYAYQAGIYTFKLYRNDSGQHTYLGLSANFKVLTDNGISDEYLNWPWNDTSEIEVQVATTSPDVEWTVKVQDS